jgi:hypothetical protein
MKAPKKHRIKETSLAELLDNVEKNAWPIVLLLYAIAAWIAVFVDIPTLSLKILPAVAATALLGVLRLITLPQRGQPLRAHGHKFDSATDDAIGQESKKIERIDLWAYTSIKYHSVLSNKDIHIGQMRILLMSPEAIRNAPTPEKNRESVIEEQHVVIENWRKLQREGRIRSLEIRQYDFCSHLHFMVINSVSAQLGFFLLDPARTGTDIPRNYSVYRVGVEGQDIVLDLSTYFDDVFKYYSVPLVE